MTVKGEIEGEWSLGSHKLLKDLLPLMKKREEEGMDPTKENSGYPDVLVTDMHTGSTIRLRGEYVRKADYVQEIHMKRSKRLIEAILMKALAQLKGNKKQLKEVLDNLRFTLEMAEDTGANINDIFTKWVNQYTDSIEEFEELLNHYVGTTLTECSGQTRIAAEVMPKEVLGMVSTDALEAFARAMVEKQEEPV